MSSLSPRHLCVISRLQRYFFIFIGLLAGFVVLSLSLCEIFLFPKQLNSARHQHQCIVLVSERKWKKEIAEHPQSKAAKLSHHNRETMVPENRELSARIISHLLHHRLGHHTQRSDRPGGRREEEFRASTARATILYGFAAGSLTNLSQKDTELSSARIAAKCASVTRIMETTVPFELDDFVA